MKTNNYFFYINPKYVYVLKWKAYIRFTILSEYIESAVQCLAKECMGVHCDNVEVLDVSESDIYGEIHEELDIVNFCI